MTKHTELLTWHRLPGQMPDADMTVLLSVEDDGDSTVAPGFWDGEAFCWCDTGGEVSGAVLGWADVPAGLVELVQALGAAEPSPTAGMSIEQRILHVGGRNNAAGYVEFGSVHAVLALVQQVLRDLPAPAPALEARCPCGLKAASDCEPWELGCDLGQSPAHVRVHKPAQAQQAGEVTLPPIPCHPDPHSYRWSKSEESSIKAYGELCAIVARAATKSTPPQAQQAAQGVPADAIREVIRISDRSHPAWDEVKAWLAATPAPAQFKPDWNKLEATQESLREHMAMLREIECPPDPETVDRELAATPPQAQQAAPLTAMQARSVVDGMGWALDEVEIEDMEMLVKAAEHACAEAWGVKLAGIGASSGSAG